MKFYLKIIEHVESIEQWPDDEVFLIDSLILGSSKLFEKIYSEIESNSFTIIFPLLRQIHDNIILTIGIYEGSYTMNKFASEIPNPKEIMDDIKETKYEFNGKEFDMLNEVLLKIKKPLNDYSHTNLDLVMMSFSERYQVPESIAFNKLMVGFFMMFLEISFIIMVNDIYKLSLPLPKYEPLNKSLKIIGNLKYITRLMPQSVKDFLENSDTLKDYYRKMIETFKKNAEELLVSINEAAKQE